MEAVKTLDVETGKPDTAMSMISITENLNISCSFNLVLKVLKTIRTFKICCTSYKRDLYSVIIYYFTYLTLGSIGPKANFVDLAHHLHTKYGNIVKLDGIFARANMVLLFEPEDFDQVTNQYNYIIQNQL